MTTIIVGAGIVGASAAYHLARKGEDVILVDKRFKGKQQPQARALFVRGSRKQMIQIGTGLLVTERFTTQS